jgi:hypothetical protein
VVIEFIDRVIVAVRDLAEARDNWHRAGFGVAAGQFDGAGLSIARVAAGAIEIDLCAISHGNLGGLLIDPMREAIGRGGGIVGWIWGATDREQSDPSRSPISLTFPGLSESAVDVEMLSSGLTGVTDARLDLDSRSRCLKEICGPNPNTVEFLEHIVVMTPSLEDAIAANTEAGVPCKRIREAGKGVRQAFFKLEQTVIEVVAPTRDRPGCWGLALMCSDIARAVEVARDSGLEATSPKQAIQGGHIARIVEPLNGIAIAYMEAGSRIDD